MWSWTAARWYCRASPGTWWRRMSVVTLRSERPPLSVVARTPPLFERCDGAAAEIAPGGGLLAAEMIVFGRTARGERVSAGRLHDRWSVRVAGRLVWVDALRLEGDIASRLDAPAGFDGATAIATAIYVGADAASRLPPARPL